MLLTASVLQKDELPLSWPPLEQEPVLFQAVLQETYLEEGIPYAQEMIFTFHCPGSHFGFTLRQNMLEACYL